MTDAATFRPVRLVAGPATPPAPAPTDPPRTADRAAAPAPPLPPAYDDHTLAGPPPAFEASLLEVTTDLRTAIARMNAARTGWAEAGIAPAPALPGLYRR